jgi:sugar lactone lactonase YvrE
MSVRHSTSVLLASMMMCSACDFLDVNVPPDPGSGGVPAGVWTVSGEPSQILRLEPVQLHGTADRSPVTTLTTTSAALATLTAVAFADDGTLWMASPDDSLVLAFAPEALANSGTRTATTVIASVGGSLRAPAGIAFDNAHQLWVANYEAGTLVRYDRDQLSTGGALEPAVVISGLEHPTGVAFDAAGGLWVSDNMADRLTRLGPEQLAASGSPAATTVVAATGGCLVNPSGLAFDASGNLWVASIGCGTVVAFDPDQLRGSGSFLPRVEVSSDPGFVLPAGLAFDADGNLWVLGATGTLTQIAKSSLKATVTATPMARLHLSGHNLFWSLAFWPIPAELSRR